MFCELLEAASFVALYGGLRAGLLQVNVQMLLQPLAVLVIFAANRSFRGSCLEPSGLIWDGAGAILWQWKNWILIVFGLLPAVLYAAIRLAWPAFLDYLAEYMGRLRALGPIYVVPFILAFTLMEEIAARGYLQARLTAAFGGPAGIVLSSAFFAWAHWTPGPGVSCVRAHLGVGFVVSLVLGWMYACTGNLFLVWAAHALWDAVLFALMTLRKRRDVPVLAGT